MKERETIRKNRIWLKLFFFIFACFLLTDVVNAQMQIGESASAMPYRYRIKQGKTIKIRLKPNVQTGQYVQSASYPDLIYVDNDVTYEGSGYTWAKVSGKEWYVATEFLDKIDNPYYVDPSASAPTITLNVEKTHNITKWILLVLCIGYVIFFIYKSEKIQDYWENLRGTPNEKGMLRLFMFNPQPYAIVLILTAMIAGGILASVATLLGIGGIVFVLLWFVKILLIIVVWVGIILCVIGVIATVCGAIPAVILAIIGGVIWYYDDSIEAFGESCVNTGLEFFNELNMISLTADMFSNYWQEGLLIIGTPIMISAACAILALLFAGIVSLMEWCITQYYNMKHPCPICHDPSEPAIYLSKGYELPVQLRPGLYGLFAIKHPKTGEQMATMLFNGRDKLPRKCPHCGAVINAKVGEEKHFTLVGLPGSGKSTLIYRIIGEMMRAHHNIDFTDRVDRDLISSTEEIKNKGTHEIISSGQIMKTNITRQRSIQLTVHRTGIPYRLFINDVAGELFTRSQSSEEKVPFFKEIQSIIFMFDPFTANMKKLDLGTEFKQWYGKHVDASENDTKEEIESAFTILKNVLENKGNKPKKVHFNFVFAKKDTGYLEGVDCHSEEALKAFAQEQLGLANELSNIENDYASVRYFAVSAVEDLPESNIELLYTTVTDQINLKL